MKKTISNLKWLPIFTLILGLIVVSCSDDDDPDPVYLLSVNPTTLALDMNDGDVVTGTITATTTQDGESFTESYSYTSSDPLVATVNNAGVVTAVAGGTATIVVQGGTSGLSANVAVTVTGADPAPVFTKVAELDGSITYTWDPAEMTVTAVAVFDETGAAELIAGGPDDDKNSYDYLFEADYTLGMIKMSPQRSDNFKAGVTVLVRITVDGATDPVWKNPTLHDKLTYSATLSTVTFEWDTASVNTGVAPSTINVFLRNDPAADGEPYTKGDPVSYAVVGSVEADTLIHVSSLVSNVSYWFEIVDASGEVLTEANLTMPSPITQVKAGNVGSIWWGTPDNDQTVKKQEVRRIADRISIGQGLTIDDIQSVKILDGSSNVIAEIGEHQDGVNTNYEYAWINDQAPIAFSTFDEALVPSALYIHDKIDPDDNANGEFKYLSFYDLPYSEDKYTVEITTKDGDVYTKQYETKIKVSTLNRSEVRANDVIYDDMAAINAKELIFKANSNVPNDTWTFTVSDPAVATVGESTGLIKFVANGISTITATSQGGTLSYQVAAAQTYCNNYNKFESLAVGSTEDMTFWSPNGYAFASATSSDEAIATVGGDNGVTITGIAEGSAVITITDDQGNEAKMTVTVVAASGE